jgi:uncharacterized membrane protein
MPEDGQRALESNGTEANSATRAVPVGWSPGQENARPGPAEAIARAGWGETTTRPGPAETATRPGPAETTARHADWAPWLIACAVFAVYTPVSVFRYLQLNPSSWDLGIFTELVKQYAHLRAPVADIRGAGVNLLGDHFSPAVALIAPFFLIVPSAVTLLVAQALLVAVSVVPVTRAAQEKLGRHAGWAVGAAYGFSWGLQQMIDFDFHEIAFAVPLLAFSLSALLRGRTRAAVAWALPLVFVKEDEGFTVAAIGLLMIIVGRWRDGSGRAAVRGGQLLIVWGIAWSVVSIAVIIPHFSLSHHYQYWSDGGTLSPGGHFSAAGVFRQLFTSWPTKLQTTLMIGLPAAFIALRSPLALAALPSVALRFLGTSSNFWGTDWHYNATVMPIIFIAAVDAIARIRAARAPLREPPPRGEEPAAGGSEEPGGRGMRRAGPLAAAIDRHGAAAMLAIALALVFQFPVSGLWNPQTYRIGQHAADAAAAMARVPDGATVTTTLDLLAPLAARTDTFWIGNAGNPNTAYIVFDGANSGYTPPPSDIPAFVASQHPGVAYHVIYDAGGVYVFRRAGG